ncbi:putative wd repeat-containing protein [Botrytis fragariae]|uniref:Putative wd repeat-containing protein n=1 Tax=Botrytis fragariae TaxID=1964551 RepID=A0A8H6AYG7_9HELO|nr:putative wd repeat-containing protein [Botrytis fragariae]KAF5876113.1 putative wd repeat-containing protein [Botrytis fragariae]
MAPAPMTRQPALVIDLTGADEEISNTPFLLPSNHGLIIPGTFPGPSTGNSRPHSNSQSDNHFAPILPENPEAEGASMPTPNGFTYAPILPGATVATRNIRSRVMPLSSDVSAIKRRDREGNKDISTRSNQEPYSEIKHASKRRRISRAPEEISSNQVLQPTIEDIAPRRRTTRGVAGQDYAPHLNGQLQQNVSDQALHPTIENAPIVRRSTRGTTEQDSTQHYNRRTRDIEEFTPQRASIPAILPPKRATSSISESSKSPVSQPTSVSSQANDRFSETIHDQVFIHINAAMARHKQTIDPKKLHEIGTSVAGVLVDSPMFGNLNRYGLSHEDEIVISEKVKQYVDEFVAYSLGPSTSFINDVDAAGTHGDKGKVKNTSSVSLPKRGTRSRTQHVQTELDSSSTNIQFLQSGSLPKTESGVFATFKQANNNTVHIETTPDLADTTSSHDTASFSQTVDGQARPYIDARGRERIRRGLQRVSDQEREVLLGLVYHIDFCEEELSIVRKVLKSQTQLRGKPSMALLMQKQTLEVPELVSLLISQPCEDTSQRLIQSRGTISLAAFLRDAANGEVSMNSRTLMVGPKRSPRQFSGLLAQREVHGMAPIRSCGGHKSYVREINSALEDSLQRKVEWTDCCGDIWAISWTSSDAFVCGATAHSDSHNMQYNKPGNLVVGSVSKETLDAMPDHRIARPIVNVRDNTENALDSMRQTQDPWLYTSISAISHSHNSGLTFTASFDGTVKVWRVSPSDTGSSMDILGTWPHEGKVNFVTTSEHHDLVATASDVYNDAVRIYRLNNDSISESMFHTYNGEKAAEQARELRDNNLWAYYPATVQWGKADSVSNLLLVGYSPRSFSNDEVDIPEDKRNSGELCLWNAFDGSKVPIASARAQNVFEVVWHPTKPTFIAATSSYGLFKSETKTQIRLFAARTDNDNYTAFYPIRVLDCPAMDINELTVMPNSFHQSYVTASCTDGNTYVWDTGAIGDDAIHVLPHGESLDNPYHDIPRELADTGVKFAAWGETSDRFYTGASDGRVKAWNIKRPPGKAFVREVLAASGGIGAGAFSSDFSKLIIGDATGKVHLLTRSEDDPELKNSDLEEPDNSSRVQPGKNNHFLSHLRGPRLIKHHPEPDPPDNHIIQEFPDTGVGISHHFVQSKFITINPDPAIGAVQGPNYHETSLYRLDAHEDQDGTKALLPYYQARQQHDLHINMAPQPLSILPNLKRSSDLITHMHNLSLSLEFDMLEPMTRRQLLEDRAQLEADDDFEYEVGPKIDIFGSRRSKRHRSDGRYIAD